MRADAAAACSVEGELTLRRHDRSRSRSTSPSATTARSARSAVVKQTDWGMKPYSALFGALKVVDEVEVAIDGHLEPQSR